jgi:spermidine synthase
MTRSALFAIDGNLPQAECVLRFLEPPDSSANALWQRLFESTYDKPFIVDAGRHRFLYFGLASMQSAMQLEHPDRLSLAYTRRMMAFLLFNASPSRILLLGLGGGSLAKFCYRMLPASAITTIEVNPHVIALREEFHIPHDDERFRVLHADGPAYVSGTGYPKDVILADACDSEGIAPRLDSLEFYQNAWSRLSDAGVFVLNLCGDSFGWHSHLAKLRGVFGHEVVLLPTRRGGNVIVFAFKEPRAKVRRETLKAAARNLEMRLGLDFPRFVQGMAIAGGGRRSLL